MYKTHEFGKMFIVYERERESIAKLRQLYKRQN